MKVLYAVDCWLISAQQKWLLPRRRWRKSLWRTRLSLGSTQ